jgi:DNA polymerase-1
MIAHYLINPDMRHNMDRNPSKIPPQPIEVLIGKKGKNQNQCAM